MRRLFAFCALLLALGTAPLFGQVNPVPFINTPLEPGAIQPGEGKFTLTVNGTGFAPGAVVNWNRSARHTTFVSTSRLMAEISRSEISEPKTALVTVTNPGPGGGTSNPVPFAVSVPSNKIAFAAPLTAAPIPAAVFPLGVGAMIAGDFNNDGKLDLAIGTGCSPAICVNVPALNPIHGMLTVYLGKGDGTFTALPPIAVPGVPWGIVAGDFYNDGNQDLAIAGYDFCGGCADVVFYHGNGDGTFAAGVTIYRTEGDYFSLAAADLNRDGHLDLVTTYATTPDPTGVTLLGNGDGTFTTDREFDTLPLPPWPAGGLAVADLNRDGILDVATEFNGCGDGCTSTDGFFAFLGSGNGSFTPIVQGTPSNPVPGTAPPLLLGGFTGTGDGIVDVVLPNPTTSELLVNRGNGDGTFTQLPNQPFVGTLMNTVADWNGDGILDVASVDSAGNLNFYRGDGHGAFQLAGTPAAGLTAGGAVALADFNKDGRPDVAYYNPTNGEVTVLLQTQGYEATVKAPLSADTSKTYKAFQGSIPVRFGLSQYGDSTCVLPPAKISLTETSGKSPRIIPDDVYVTWPDNGKHFVADKSACEYTYNLATWSLPPGTYQIQISLYDVVAGGATFKLK